MLLRGLSSVAALRFALTKQIMNHRAADQREQRAPPGDVASDGSVPDLELERINDDIVKHCLRCGTCWRWRYELWRWDQLCVTGAVLFDRYTVAEASLGHACHTTPERR